MICNDIMLMSRGLSKSNFWSYLNDYTLKQWLQKAMGQQMYHERFRTLLLKPCCVNVSLVAWHWKKCMFIIWKKYLLSPFFTSTLTSLLAVFSFLADATFGIKNWEINWRIILGLYQYQWLYDETGKGQIFCDQFDHSFNVV